MILALATLLSLSLLPAGVRDDADLARLAARLRERNKWTRASAVRELARCGDPEGLELVVEALADPAGEVADTAQLELGRLEGRRVRELLVGRSALLGRDPWVALRSAEALGRVPVPVDGEALARAARGRDPSLRRTALWSIERQARAGRLVASEEVVGAVRRVHERDRDPGVRARALFALGALEPGTPRLASATLAALGDARPELRCAAAALAPDALEPDAAAEALGPRLEDDVRAVRVQAARALARLANASAARLLVGALEAEPRGRERWHVLAALRAASGLRHGFDPRPWNAWVGSLAPDWRGAPARSHGGPRTDDPGSAAPVEASARGADARSVAFAGLPILSDRLAFLIDLSGSIWQERADGRTPKDVVDEELGRVLEALPEETRFNLIPFTGEPHPWQDELVRASPRNVRDAGRWFERMRRRGTGNFWDAALLALEDPDVDTLVVLTDGVPTGGRRTRMELIVPLFLERDVSRMVAVDSILVGAREPVRRQWEALARGTGGRSVALGGPGSKD